MRPKRIMLIEDDVNLCQSLKLILQRAGYFVTSTDCVTTAINIIQNGNYYLVIADINMPETNNLLLPRVLGSYPHLSIVILTDQSVLEIEKGNMHLSAHYLLKPIAPERLIDCVGTLIGKNNHINHPYHNSVSK
jgi:DNA-binding NtrC family response regulator